MTKAARRKRKRRNQRRRQQQQHDANDLDLDVEDDDLDLDLEEVDSDSVEEEEEDDVKFEIHFTPVRITRYTMLLLCTELKLYCILLYSFGLFRDVPRD